MIRINCRCKPFCLGTKWCGAKYNTLAMIKDENGKPSWFLQKSIDSTSPEWEKISHPNAK